MVGNGPKKWRAKKRECIYTCNRVRSAVLCNNALNRQDLVPRSLVDEALDIRLRQQAVEHGIWVGVYQKERHLGMRNAKTSRPQEPITPLGLQTYHLYVSENYFAYKPTTF